MTSVPPTHTAVDTCNAPNNSLVTRQFSRRAQNIMCALVAALLCLGFVFLAQNPVLAEAGDDIVAGVSNAGQSVWKVARNIAVIAAIIVVIAAGFEFFLGGQRGGQIAKTLLIAAVAGLAIVLLAPTIVSFLASIFSSSSEWTTVTFS